MDAAPSRADAFAWFRPCLRHRGGLALWRWGGKYGRAWRWSLLGVVALLSHAALDLLNGGVSFWLPFSDAWVSWADLPVVDPLTLGILTLCYVANHPPRLIWNRNSPEYAVEKAWRTANHRLGDRYGKGTIAWTALTLVTFGVLVRIVM